MSTEQITTLRDCEDRYHHDIHFRSLVDLMMRWVTQYKYTPSELRDAAFIASLNVERMRPAGPIVFIEGDSDDWPIKTRP